MPELSSEVKAQIDLLRTGYKGLSGFSQFFFPSSLATVLHQNSPDLEVGKVAFASTRFYHRLFFPFLNRFFKAKPIVDVENIFQTFSQTSYPSDTTILKKEIDDLKTYYSKRNRIEKFFFPSALSKAINEDRSPLEIGAAAFQGTWFFHRLFFPFLNRFFNHSSIASSRWLFDPTSLPKTSVGKFFGNNSNMINQDLSPEVREPIEALKKYYADHAPFTKYLFPSSLIQLLESNEIIPDFEIKVVQAVHRDAYFYHDWLFPTPFKKFREETQQAMDKIDNSTYPEGIKRIQRNIKILTDIAQKAKSSKEQYPELALRTNLDTEIASLISLLNPPSKRSSLNAQQQLELIREIDNRVEGPLYVCDALSLYFNNKPSIIFQSDNPEKPNDVDQFNSILRAFNETGTSGIYALLRNKEVPILQKSDETTRENILKITKIPQKANAQIVFELLKNAKLLTSDTAQANFNQVTNYSDLNVLKDALTILNTNHLLTQENFNKIIRPEVPAVSTAKHIVESTQAIIKILNDHHLETSIEHINFRQIASYSQDIHALEEIIDLLARHELLTQTHLEFILQHPKANALSHALHKMDLAQVLNLNTFKTVSAYDVDPETEVLKILPQKTIAANSDEILEASLQAKSAGELFYALAGGAARWLWNQVVLPSNSTASPANASPVILQNQSNPPIVELNQAPIDPSALQLVVAEPPVAEIPPMNLTQTTSLIVHNGVVLSLAIYQPYYALAYVLGSQIAPHIIPPVLNRVNQTLTSTQQTLIQAGRTFADPFVIAYNRVLVRGREIAQYYFPNAEPRDPSELQMVVYQPRAQAAISRMNANPAPSLTILVYSATFMYLAAINANSPGALALTIATQAALPYVADLQDTIRQQVEDYFYTDGPDSTITVLDDEYSERIIQHASDDESDDDLSEYEMDMEEQEVPVRPNAWINAIGTGLEYLDPRSYVSRVNEFLNYFTFAPQPDFDEFPPEIAQNPRVEEIIEEDTILENELQSNSVEELETTESENEENLENNTVQTAVKNPFNTKNMLLSFTLFMYLQVLANEKQHQPSLDLMIILFSIISTTRLGNLTSFGFFKQELDTNRRHSVDNEINPTFPPASFPR